jgi:hypothetical protein
MGTPAYFGYLSAVFSFLYLYIFVPLSIILESYILVAYSANMVGQENIPAQSKFRRGVAVFLPFLLSLYAVLVSEIYGVSGTFYLPFYYLLIGGLLIGFAFMHWISGISDSDELFSTLSCFVASLIFFAVLTVFIITRSFEIISFVFGFLFGVSIYVIRYGFSNLERLKLPKPKFTFLKRAVKAIRDLRERQKSAG